jgi:hypothetical protein
MEFSSNKDKAISSGTFINKPISINLTGDSLSLVEPNLDFWLEKEVHTEKYGILPLLHFRQIYKEYCLLHISRSPKDKKIMFKEESSNMGLFNFESGSDNYLIRKLPHDTISLVFFFETETVNDTVKVKLEW